MSKFLYYYRDCSHLFSFLICLRLFIYMKAKEAEWHDKQTDMTEAFLDTSAQSWIGCGELELKTGPQMDARTAGRELAHFFTAQTLSLILFTHTICFLKKISLFWTKLNIGYVLLFLETVLNLLRLCLSPLDSDYYNIFNPCTVKFFFYRKNAKVQKRGKINLIGRLQLTTERMREEENEGIVQLRILRTQVCNIKKNVQILRKLAFVFKIFKPFLNLKA